MNCCANCFVAPFLKDFIGRNGVNGDCSFCNHSDVKTVDTLALRELFEPLFALYAEASQENLLTDDEPWDIGDALGRLIYQEWDVFSEDVCNHVEQIVTDMCRPVSKDDFGLPLAEGPAMSYTRCFWYQSPGEYWREFVKHITQERRYVLDTDPRNDVSIWDPRDWLPKTLDLVLKKLPKGTEVWRSRRHEDPLVKPLPTRPPSPDWLGAPPPELTTAGRANARGIPVFYAAYDEDTAASEVRPAIGQHVWTARWCLTASMYVADLREVPQLDTPFGYPNLRNEIEYREFLEEVSAALAVPVAPQEEDIAYVPTQYVIEVMKGAKCRGVLFPSSQKPGGTNVIIFDPEDLHYADEARLSRVESISYGFKQL